MIHPLKLQTQFFLLVADGFKKFEVRKNDRNFCVGDVLLLREWFAETQVFTGREVVVHVDYILQGGQFGIEAGFVCMSITVLRQ